MRWEDGIQFLKGVGPQRSALFARLGIFTAGDLLTVYPRGYVDYSAPVEVINAPYDMPCALRARVLSKDLPVRIKGGRTLFRVWCADDSAPLGLLFFNNPYGVKKLEVGGEYLFYGRVGGGFAGREMIAPAFIPAGAAAPPLAAIYPLTAGLSNYTVASCVESALAAVSEIPEPLLPDMLERYGLPGKKEALRMVHRPCSMEEVYAARRRLAFEELLCLQLGLLLFRSRAAAQTGAPMRAPPAAAFERALPFTLTGAQKRSIAEITEGMTGSRPMNRLLQGDVGSGKTLVAAAGIYMAAKNGYQSVLMAPTEILARQHAETMDKFLAPLGITVALLTAGIKTKARKNTLDAIARGKVDLVVGTHAVLSGDVEFASLGFAVTDEQHRFGVRQRGILARKAESPHLLVMSATPIPRTLALLMFGDLEISVLDELPPGRGEVKTRQVPARRRADMFGFLLKQIKAGRQVYIVCPLIGLEAQSAEKDAAAQELQAAVTYLQDVARPALTGARVEVLHGRMKAADKTALMQAFKAGEIDALVATTVIEVGLDVPNATVMVIEDAERYGLSALHQLRGRVGRGGAESWCFLVSAHAGPAARERLEMLCSFRDGFRIAEYDLKTRGPGDFFGSRQHGLPILRAAELGADTKMLKVSRDEAVALFARAPKLAGEEYGALAAAVRQMFERGAAMN